MAKRSAMQGGYKLDLFLRNAKRTWGRGQPPSIEVGFFSDARYSPDARRTPHYGDSRELVATVAQKHEYGLGVPKRPFFRRGIKRIEQSADIDNVIKEIVRLDGNANPRSFDLIGQISQDLIKLSIVRKRRPPNSPRTIQIKGSDNPLIDTGYMLNSVTYKVRR